MSKKMEAIDKLDARKVSNISTQASLSPIATKTSAMTVAHAIFGSSDEEMRPFREPVVEELERFRCEPKVKNDVNILDWWKKRAGVYPILSEISKFYLCIPATSVSTERVFSTGGNVITKLRMSMTDEHANQLILLSKNKNKTHFW